MSPGGACERNVPGHHPALEQVANAPRYPHRLVEEVRLERDHTVTSRSASVVRVTGCHPHTIGERRRDVGVR